MSTANRLRSTMGLMARDNDNEAVIALRQATRMLKGLGLDWSDVAETVLRMKPANDTAARPAAARPQPNPYAQPQAKPQPEPQPRPQPQPQPQQKRPRILVDGYSIPQRITGQIVMQTFERTSKGGPMTVFLVKDGDTLYGPIVAYTDYRVHRVSVMERKQARVEVRMLKPGQGRHMAGGGFMPQAGEIVELS